MPDITLREYGAPRLWPGSHEELGELLREGARWKEVLGLRQSPFALVSEEPTLLRAEGVAGFLRVGTCNVEIQPKFLDVAASDPAWRAALWRILSIVEEQPDFGPDYPTHEEDEDLPDLLGWIFLRSAQSVSEFPRGYTSVVAQAAILRGRLDTARVWRFGITTNLIPATTDEYDMDIPLNRLFKWASRVLLGNVQSSILASRLNEVATMLHEVKGDPPGLIEADLLRLPQLMRRLEPALSVSRVLLRRQALVHSGEGAVAPSFLWAASEIFERFVLYLLRLAARRGNARVEEGGLTLGVPRRSNDRALTSDPDARVTRRDRTLAVVDAKYKVGGSAKHPSAADVYQVMAGCRLTTSRRGVLVYPVEGDQRETHDWSIVNVGSPRFVRSASVDMLAMSAYGADSNLASQLWSDIFRHTAE